MGPALTLLNPGPINVTERVRAALAECEDQCHREPEYLAMQGRVRLKLADAFGVARGWEPVLLTGSGTAAMEAMVASVVERGVLVVDNGVYGARFAAIAEAHRIPAARVEATWFERVDPDAVRDALRDEYDTIAVVHHETTTGLINDVEAIAEVARDTGRRLIVDSVSGLAGERFDFDAIRPTAVCCTANKCIQGLPGVSFVLVERDARLQRRSVYLDLGTLSAKQRAGDTPFTPAIQVTAALEAALDELLEETVEGRIARYARAASVLRGAIERLGLELRLPPTLRSNTITCARLPEGVPYAQIHDRMRDEGYVVYAGQGALQDEAFRVANMGAIPEEALDRFGEALGRAIASGPGA
jgi:2-aminoethylphosphonate-pyruvate transaminase